MNIQTHLDYLKGITSPEDLFGSADLKTVFREWAIKVHPDNHANNPLAEEAFKILESLKAKAETKIENGTYGDKSVLVDSIKLSSKNSLYTLTRQTKSGSIYDEYRGLNATGQDVICKIVRSPKNNDLLNNEAKILTYLRDSAPTKDLEAMAHIPKFIESFILLQNKERRQVNVLKAGEGFYTLQEIIEAYPAGLDPRDAAWMFNRFIGSLVISHQAGIVNAGVLPSQFVVNIKGHNGILKDWIYSVDINSSKKLISAIDTNFKEYYPPEVFNKVPATFSMDIYMAAMCMLKLLGGDVKTRVMPSSVPVPLQGLIRACLLGPSARILDIWYLYDEFNSVLERLYGKKVFRTFSLDKS